MPRYNNPRAAAGYTKLAWIDRGAFLPSGEYYDAQKQLVRVFTADEVRDVNDAHRRSPPMKNVKSGHRTEVVFRGCWRRPDG